MIPVREVLGRILFYAPLGAVISILYVMASDRRAGSALIGAASGAVVAGSIAAFEKLVRGGFVRWLLELPLGLFVLARAAIWTLCILAGLVVGRLGEAEPTFGGHFLADAAFSFGISIVILATAEVSRLLGRRELFALVLGRYVRPQQEDRIFLLLDLVGSTALATERGDAAYLRILNEVLREVTPIVRRHRGEIYRYVGDAVFITWSTRRGKARPSSGAIACALDCIDTARRTKARLRAAVHAGPVIAAEIGIDKREIAFVGDTMNTLARLEQVARDEHRDLVVSDEVLSAATLPADARVDALGSFTLRGRAEPLQLYALDRSAGSGAEALPRRISRPQPIA